MITPHELFCVLLLPLLVASALTLGARITARYWLYSIAAGAAFLTGYSQLGVPSFPPRDGIDWLFWLAIPLSVLGALDTHFKPKVGWLAGLGAALSAALIAAPLLPGGVSIVSLALMVLGFAIATIVLVTLLEQAAMRVGSLPIQLGLCGIAGGAAVLILSCNLRILGVYGLATAAAVGPVAVIGGYGKSNPKRGSVARGVATLIVPLLVAELIGGHLYADPGVTWFQILLLFASMLLLAGIALAPVGKPKVRAVVALIATAALVGAVVAPAALAAKKAAADDPYAEPGK